MKARIRPNEDYATTKVRPESLNRSVPNTSEPTRTCKNYHPGLIHLQ